MHDDNPSRPVGFLWSRAAALLAASLLAAGCHPAKRLRKDVQDHCRDEAMRIGVALTEAHEGQTRVVGFGEVAGGPSPDAVFRAFSFCASVRAVDETEKVKARSEFQHAVGEFVAATAAIETRHSTDRKPLADALSKMAALYQRVNAWPVE